MRDIKANDLIVWTQWFQTKHGEQAEDIQKQMDFIWLYLRITYESYESESDEIFEKIAENMEVTRRKLTQILSSERRNSSNGTVGESLKNWRDIIRGAYDAWNSAEWDESEGKGQKKRTDDEFVQKLHFEVIRDLCENIHKTDEMVQQKFAKIIKGLNENKECRQNLNSFLKKEQIKKIFEVIGIPFDEKDFESSEQKMEFSSDHSEEKGKETLKKGRKNRRNKNGQKMGNKNEEKWESEKENGEKWTKNGEEKVPNGEEKESQKVPKEEKESQKVPKEEKESQKVPKEEKESQKVPNGEEKESQKVPKEEKESQKVPKEEKSEPVPEEEEEEQLLNTKGKFRSDAQKMTKQIEIEQILFDRMMAKESGKELANCLSPSFAKVTQQLISDKLDEQNSQKLEQFVEEKAINGQRAEGKSRKKREKRIKAAVNKVKEMVGEWSNHQAKLLISGSFLLGLNTTDSDIDLICVVPGKAIEKVHFFGEPNEICVERECEKGGGEKDTLAQSFYCQLCGNGKVSDLIKITKGQIVMIKFTFDGIDFDISLVAIPEMETLAQRITDRTLRHYVNKFDTENFEHRQMLRVLSSYLSNVHIVKLFDENQKKTFILNDDISDEKIRQNGRNYENLRFLTLALKLWAKANFIYSNKFGFLNGVILTIMASKIVLLYPNSSLRFLLLKFFLIYAAKPDGMPIQLEQIEEKSKMSTFLTKNPMENEMKIYTTVFPEQNAARLITYENAKIIRKAMIEALNRIINSDDWPTILWTNSVNFVEKYKTFIAINCLGQNAVFVRNFCQFVEGRIRLQMAYDIGHRGATTNWHIYPALFHETCQITHKLEQIPAKFRSNYHQCKVWLIGTDQSLNGTDQRLINGQLRNFDWAIKRDFLKFNGKLSNKAGGDDIDGECQRMGVTLKSVFVEELAHLLSSSN
ncbi:hypothetical protein niasHT_027594 [Heterodera trifolii]|uniref:polynucleotide adenylyltransferase n=1 Tax=Heterodera trifolii TaxID=157864 RepID=A0ABD2K616_9BILA